PASVALGTDRHLLPHGRGRLRLWPRLLDSADLFNADHQQCFNVATIPAGFGSAAAYKACMGEKGWIRVQAVGSQPVPEPHFQGPEDDAEFAPVSSTRQPQ